MDKNSNGYTFAYALIVVLACASLLTLSLNALNPRIKKNVEVSQKLGILQAVNPEAEKGSALTQFDERVEQIVLDHTGAEIESELQASQIDIRQENKLPLEERRLPLFVYSNEKNEKSYIVPLSGAGLWGWVNVNLALDTDLNTIKGATFSHETETPGLGAEITTGWYQGQFKGKTLTNDKGEYHLKMLKGKGNKQVQLDNFSIDGITGATVTCDGVGDMISAGFAAYQNYFKKQLNK